MAIIIITGEHLENSCCRSAITTASGSIDATSDSKLPQV
jgi:hypothetical protein